MPKKTKPDFIIDAIAAPEGSGGPHEHARQLIAEWAAHRPTDHMLVLGDSWIKGLQATYPNVRHLSVPARSLPGRILNQWLLTPFIAILHPRTPVIATLPVLSPFLPRRRAYCFVHDWRHITRPTEFTAARRFYRRLWLHSVNRARAAFCISTKTERETREIAPNARTFLAQNGMDHVRHWQRAPSSNTRKASPSASILTFGHRNNKRADLVIQAAAHARHVIFPFHLTIVGAAGSERQRLVRLSEHLNIVDLCSLPGFVPDDELHRLMSESDVVALASTDEGYGLPAAEAIYLGKQVVVCSDSGMGEIFGGIVIECEPSPSAFADGVQLAIERSRLAIPEAEPHVTQWSATVDAVRAVINTDTQKKP